MLRFYLFLAAMSFVISARGSPESNAYVAPISLDVVQETMGDGQLALAIKLTNNGIRPLRFSTGSGPWVGVDQIQLVAIKLPLGVAIPNELRSMRDPALGHTTIDPGKSKEEKIPLNYLYPELAAELRTTTSQYILFWTYQLHTDSVISKRVGGWLIISGRGKPDE